MNCIKMISEVEEHLKSPCLSTDGNITPAEFLRHDELAKVLHLSQHTKIEAIQKSLHQTQVPLSQLSSPFTIRTKGSAFTKAKELSQSMSNHLMPLKKKIICDINLENKDTILKEEVTKSSTAFEDLGILRYWISAFRVVNANEDRVAFFRARISGKVCIDEPRIKNELADTSRISLEELAEPAEASSVTKSRTSSDLNIKVSSSAKGNKRSVPETTSQDSVLKSCETFQCNYCGAVFGTGQALGGHMSRKHSGKSAKYNHKKSVRANREFERMKLHVAKRKYFEKLGYDYDEMMQSLEGKIKVKNLMDRSQIKKIKASLSEKEVYSSFK